jgi:glycosyltransferase involved in cell wall biosynthesis
MKIAMIGTRGVPASYGGFETAVEEIGSRLVQRGHTVTVYCRRGNAPTETAREYRGMRLVTLPAVRTKSLETLSHTALSVGHVALSQRYDAAFVFNAANAPFLPVLRLRRTPVALHVDGLEWKRAKWGGRAKAYYRWAEQTGIRTADALIADAQGIADYYTHQFGVETTLLTYGAPILRDVATDALDGLELVPNGYHLVVARMEPENHVDMIVEGYRLSGATDPLVVVGSAPYGSEYTALVHQLAGHDDRIRFLGGVYDQDVLDQLYAHALTYLHGHSVGGTNPSLLRAMGAGTAVIAYDVAFNREVLGADGEYFTDPESAGVRMLAAEQQPADAAAAGASLRERAAAKYDWDTVAAGYEDLAERLRAGSSTRARLRRSPVEWPGAPSTGGSGDDREMELL